MIGFSGVGSMTSTTASTTSFAYANSVPVNDSGEYSHRQFVFGYSLAIVLINSPASVANFLIAALSLRNTTFRCKIDVEL